MPSPALNRVAAPEALDDEVEALVARIVAKPRVAIALGKALFYRQLEQGIVDRVRQSARRGRSTPRWASQTGAGLSRGGPQSHDEVVGVSLHIIWKAA